MVGARRILVATLACIGAVVAAPDGLARASAGDRLVIADTMIDQLFVLDGIALYRRDTDPEDDLGGTDDPGTWFRVIDGRREEVRGLPDGTVPTSLGRDAQGRVVATVRLRRPAALLLEQRWWLLDVRADRSRPFPVATTEPRCYVNHLAVWRDYTAFGEHCWEMIDDPIQGPGYAERATRAVLRTPKRRQQVFEVEGFFGLAEMTLRAGSFAARGTLGGYRYEVWRFTDRGRRCPTRLADLDPDRSHYTIIGIGQGRLMWGTSTRRGMALSHVELAGRCAREPRVGVFAIRLPTGPVALDRRWLYYATDDGVHRRKLPDR